MRRRGMRMRIQWSGLEEIRNALDLMPQEVIGAHLRAAAEAGAEPIRKQAVDNALKHKRTGTLARSVRAEIAERQSTNTRVIVLIGPTKEGWYGRLVEYGHAIVRVTGRVRRGRRTYRIKEQLGQVPPHPWLRPAYDAKRGEAQEVMAAELRRRLERVWRRR